MKESKAVLLLMQRLMNAIRTAEDAIEPHVAIPALNYVLGFVLGQGLEDNISDSKLNEVYSQIISEIDHSRRTTTAIVATVDAIDKARH